ncbi:probable myosin light chain kinase DDB_G0271550 isoform X2 [Ambystoma mexicanum]|uniref:probable myosin light chain kinase DDB_G0271550 isoform X2 n=1 Tax=Ambystoma mexicanum TaxID=8296 RepID=UPI0037E9652D
MFAADYTLGEGRCGKVVKRLYNGIPAAVKIVPLEKTDEDHLYRECRIYGKLNHKNVVKLLGPPVKRGDAWHIPLELIEGRNLEELIYGGQLTEADKDLIILGMCEGLNYLHQNDVVHQDLKPNNIMEKNPLIEIMPRSSRTLGEGCCGKVRKGKYNGNTAAIKIVPLDETDKDHLNREYRIYKALNHKNVVKVLGPPEKHHDGWHIPLELIKGRTLEELIFSPGEQLSEEEKYCIILGMCKGLKYLHQNDVVHQDLKPNNIMVKDSTKEAVIIDLGLSKFIDYTESGSPFSTGSNRGFRQYAAPEARAGKIRSRKSDVWSMGKVIAEVLLEHGLDLEECTSKNVGNLLHGSKVSPAVLCCFPVSCDSQLKTGNKRYKLSSEA